MNKLRLTVGAVALGVVALSAYGCSSEAAVIDDADDDGTSSSSSGKAKTDAGKSSSSGGRSSSSGSSSGRSGSSSSSGNTPTDGGTSSGDAGTDAGPTDGCLTVTTQQWTAATRTTSFRAHFTPLLPGTSLGELNLDFFFGGDVVGVHDLAAPPNDSIACEQCIEANADLARFFQTQGTLTVTAIGPSSVTATFSNVKLVEVDSDDYEPLPGGRCIRVTNGTIEVRP